MALPYTYANAVWEGERALTTWLPDRHIRPGDIVTREGGGPGLRVETRLGSLMGSSEPARISRDGAPRVVLQDGVELELLSGAAAPGARARARMTRESSFLLAAEKGRISEYRRLAEVREQVSALQAAGRWQWGWHLITAVRSFAAATLLIAESSGAEASVEVEPGDTAGLELLRAGGAVTVTGGSAASWSLAACTPLYEALCVRRRPLRGAQVTGSFLGERTASPVADGEELAVDTSRPEDFALLDGGE